METIAPNKFRATRTDRLTPADPSPVRIVIFQRGWAIVGRYRRDGDLVILDDAQVIRRWGTTRGLGEIAAGGPTEATVLDPAPRVEAHHLTVILTIDCDPTKWDGALTWV